MIIKKIRCVVCDTENDVDVDVEDMPFEIFCVNCKDPVVPLICGHELCPGHEIMEKE